MLKEAELPRVRTKPDFRKKVFKACESIDMNYSTVVTRLLERWLVGDIQLEIELDQQFIATAEAAINSPRGQAALKDFAKNHDPKRKYPNAIPV